MHTKSSQNCVRFASHRRFKVEGLDFRSCIAAPVWTFITFSVRATTIARMATSTNASQMATGGLLLLALLQTVTACIRTRRMSSLRVTVTAGTVLPFAVWYGRGERKLYLLHKKGGSVSAGPTQSCYHPLKHQIEQNYYSKLHLRISSTDTESSPQLQHYAKVDANKPRQLMSTH